MGLAFRLKTYTEILDAMFNTARSPTGLGKGVDLNRGSIIRTIFEAAALQDSEQYAQIALLLDLFSIDTCHNTDLDRRFLDFGTVFDEDLRRLGALTSVGNITVGDTALQVVNGTLAADVNAGDLVFAVNQPDPPNDFATIVGGTVFMVAVGSAALGQQERVLVSITASIMTLLAPVTGFQFLHRVGEPVRLTSVATQLTAPVIVGALALPITPGTGALFTPGSSIIIDRGDLVKRELKTVLNVVGNTINITTVLAFSHVAGTTIYKSTVGSDRNIGTGTQVFVPSNFGTKQIDFMTTAAGVLFDGDRESSAIPIESLLPGKDTKVTSDTINTFSAKPFPTATVTNPEACVRGRDREDDTDYLPRGKTFLQSLSRGTKTSLEARTIGLLDPVSQKTVAFNEIVEPVGFGVSNLYITDGTTSFSIVQTPAPGREVLIRSADDGDRRSKLKGSPPYAFNNVPGNITPRVFKSFDLGNATSTGPNTITDTSRAAPFDPSRVGKYVKVIDDTFYLIVGVAGFTLTVGASGATPALGPYSIFDFSVDPLIPTTQNPPEVGADYVFDPSTGDLELVASEALFQFDGMVAADDNSTLGKYQQSSGLGAYIQKVVNGDPSDFTNFPGVKACGTQVFVRSPSVTSPIIIVRIEPLDGFSNDQLAPFVQSAVERIVNSGGIGENVVLSDIVVEIKTTVTGIRDAAVVDPKENIPVLSGQIARITAASVIVV